ncbi:MAG: hypothetical protein Q8N76_02135, partial [Candidatus Omnitrophota bacterium]|nr:hypothetical protein [Candidatus Omnitrophota bacterium]
MKILNLLKSIVIIPIMLQLSFIGAVAYPEYGRNNSKLRNPMGNIRRVNLVLTKKENSILTEVLTSEGYAFVLTSGAESQEVKLSLIKALFTLGWLYNVQK